MGKRTISIISPDRNRAAQTLSRRGVEGNAYAQHGSEVPWMAYRSAILYRKSMRQDTIHGAGFESCRLDQLLQDSRTLGPSFGNAWQDDLNPNQNE